MTRVVTFFARRVVAAIFTLLAMITITFAIFWLIPSEPAHFLYPFAQVLNNYEVHRANHLFGLDQSKIVQWWHYVSHIARGDFGHQWGGVQVNGDQSVTLVPISPGLYAATRVTLSIMLGGAVLVLLLALPLGALAARYQNSIGDRLLGFLTLLAICTHPMVVGLILRTVFVNKLGWIGSDGYCTFGHHPVPPSVDAGLGPTPCAGGPLPWAEHLILPWISFALLFLALYVRMSRASVLDVLYEDFVRTARAKGASETRVLGRHVLPNAGIRVLTMIGMEISTAIGIAVYIEAAFEMHGLARMAVDAFSGAAGLDLPVILAVVTMITVIVIVGNLVVDLLYAVLDPRVGGATMRMRRSAETPEPAVVS